MPKSIRKGSSKNAILKPSLPGGLWFIVSALMASLTGCGGGGGSTYAPIILPSPDVYEQDDNSTSAKVIAVNSFQNRNHYDDAHDWMRFEAIAAHQYTIETSNLGKNEDTIMDLYDQDLSWLGYDDDGGVGDASKIVWTAPASGTYYIYVGSYWGTTGTGTAYTITLTEQAPPPQPDLLSTSMSVPVSAASNGPLTFSDTITNQGGAASGGFYVDYYLSDNSTISASDTYLGSRRISSLDAGASSTVTSSFAIPGSAVVGNTYYVGALVDGAYEVTELFEANNTSSPYPVTITPAQPADLTISSLSGTPTLAAGQVLTVSDTVSNSASTAYGVDVYYYLSTDASIDNLDTYIGSRYIASIDTTNNVNSGLGIQIPRSYPAGSYYLGAIVDPLDTVLENNNSDNVSNAVPVTVTAPIPSDLIFTVFSPDAVVNTYNEMTITDTVTNQGSGDEGAFDVKYYLSSDNIIDPAIDTYLGKRSIVSLAAGASDNSSVKFSINRAVGTYYIGAVIDGAGSAIESDTTNNASGAYSLSVVKPDLAVSSFDVTPTTAQVNDVITLNTTVQNLGVADVTDSFYIYYYISTDDVITTSDYSLGSKTVSGLAGGASSYITVDRSIMSSLPYSPTYYIGAIVDPYNSLNDANTANNKSASIPMAISVCTPDPYEEDDSSTYAKPIGVGATQAHNFCEDISDWLSFSAVAGTSYTIETTIPDTENTDTVLYLYDTNATTQLGYDDDGGTTSLSSRISSWIAPGTGTYYIKVTNFINNPGYAKGYSVTLTTP